MQTMTIPLPTGGAAVVQLPASAQSGDVSLLGQMLIHLGAWWDHCERQADDWRIQIPCLPDLQDRLP